MFGACDCTIQGIRQKEDMWNGILSGAATGGLLSIRQGVKVAAKSAAVGVCGVGCGLVWYGFIIS